MSKTDHPKKCPMCGSEASVRPKLVLIHEAWIDTSGKDSRLKYFADLRVDDVKADNLKESPLEQFIEGYWCENCGRAFVSEEILNEDHRRYK